MASSFILSSSEKRYILNGCRDNVRMDGRSCDEFRSYSIVVGGETFNRQGGNNDNNNNNNEDDTMKSSSQPPLILSNGSSRLFLAASGSTSSTHIICSVKAELVHPSLENPTRGQLQINVEYASGTNKSLLSSSTSSTRQNNQENHDHLQSTLSKLLQTHLLDLDALCIVPYHYVWNLQIDLLILSGMGGNLVDACTYALRAALQHTLLPNVVTTTEDANNDTTTNPMNEMGSSANADLIVDSDIHNAKIPPGTDKSPTIITITILKDDDDDYDDDVDNGQSSSSTNTSGWHLLLDATLEEHACSYCQVHVAVQNEYICALTKSGGGSIPINLLTDITSLALKSSKAQQERYTITCAPDNSNYGCLQEQFFIQ